jgi:hypothetical protein
MELDGIRIRPIQGGTQVSSAGCAALVAGVIVTVVALRLGLPRHYGWGLGWWALVVTALPVLLLATRALLGRRNLMLIAGPGYVTRVDWLGRRRTFHRDEIVAVLRASVVYGRGQPMPNVFVIGAANRRLMLLLPWMWNERDLDELWRRVGIEPQGQFEDIETAAGLAARMPGLIPAWRADPRFVPVAATIAAIVLALIVFRGLPGVGGP